LPRSGVERFVWSGDNILWEMRGPGADSVTAQQLEQAVGTGVEYGRIGYTHAGGVDRPLVVWKGTGGAGSDVVVPHLNWRGLFGRGTDVSGNPTGIEIEWPGFQTTAYHSMGPTQAQTRTWMGSLLEGQRDAGGQMYMRNRYYDPATGQFTQPDPIGIAGGLNVYGFAAGDPVSYTDPYGLSAERNGDDDPSDLPKLLEQLAQLTNQSTDQVRAQLMSRDGLRLGEGTRMNFGGGNVLTARADNVLRLSADGTVATGGGFSFTDGQRTAVMSSMQMEFNDVGEATTLAFRGRSGIAPVSGTITFARGVDRNPTNCRVRLGPIVVRNGSC
jgi:RHS repeat-associated protein